MPRKIRILLLAAVVICMLAFVWLNVFTAGRPPAGPPLPNPNGYDDFISAAALLTGDLYGASTLDSLRALVATNSEPLRLLRLGLTRRCALPANSAMTNVAGMGGDLARLKRLAHLLTAEGLLAEMEGRYADAAQSYVDAIRFGNEISRGGFVINRLVGIACEAIGDTPLSKLPSKLNSQEARRVIAELEKVDSTGVTWEEVRRNESRFVQYQLSKGVNIISWAMTRQQVWRSRRLAEVRHKRVVAQLRLLATELALRCYQSEEGHPPTILEQLAPKYLQRLPSDPFSGRPLVYRALGTNWLLYSVGPDGVDDGGKGVGRSAPGTFAKGDLFYDSPY